MWCINEAEYSAFIWLWWFAIGDFAAVQAPVELKKQFNFSRLVTWWSYLTSHAYALAGDTAGQHGVNIHIIFWIFSYIKSQILKLFFFILARIDLFLYVNFWSCLWVHWVTRCQITTACRAHPLKVLWVTKCGWCLEVYAYCGLLIIFKGDFGHLGTEIVV